MNEFPEKKNCRVQQGFGTDVVSERDSPYFHSHQSIYSNDSIVNGIVTLKETTPRDFNEIKVEHLINVLVIRRYKVQPVKNIFPPFLHWSNNTTLCHTSVTLSHLAHLDLYRIVYLPTSFLYLLYILFLNLIGSVDLAF